MKMEEMRRWFRNRCMVAAFASALALVMVASLVAFAARRDASAASPWQQGPAPALPHTIADLGGARIALVDDNGHTRIRLDCANGSGETVIVTLTTEPKGGTGTRIAATAPSCTAGLPSGWGGDLLDRLAVGDRVWITLQAPGERLEQKEALLYMMGTDGRLRPGAGSVWR